MYFTKNWFASDWIRKIKLVLPHRQFWEALIRIISWVISSSPIVFNNISMLIILIIYVTISDLFCKLQTWISNCLLKISTWMSSRHKNLKMAKTELLNKKEESNNKNRSLFFEKSHKTICTKSQQGKREGKISNMRTKALVTIHR